FRYADATVQRLSNWRALARLGCKQMAAEPCPTRDELAAFALGDLSRDRFEPIAAHAERCPRCARTLSELDELPDPLIEGLRGPTSPEPGWSMPENIRSALLSLCDGNGVTHLNRPHVGSRLGKFELIEQLGTGAFGEVF